MFALCCYFCITIEESRLTSTLFITLIFMSHELYMQRCFDLAALGAGHTSPNPMVGAVLVYEGRILGEGYHARYGGPHAEVNAVASVPTALRHLIPRATLYVSLEPCCISGKTGPCTQLILEQGIPRVVISCIDLTPGVAGRGIEILRAAGVEVITGILEDQGQYLARVRNHFVTRKQPYITIKYAQTRNGFFAPTNPAQAWISGPLARRFVHRLRSEHDAILVGTRTVRIDNPRLDNRYYYGPSPRRIVLDQHLRLPAHLHVFDKVQPTLVVNASRNNQDEYSGMEYVQADFASEHFWPGLWAALYHRRISSVLVEGGARVIQSLFDGGYWQEAWVITGSTSLPPDSMPAPRCPGRLVDEFVLDGDIVQKYQPY